MPFSPTAIALAFSAALSTAAPVPTPPPAPPPAKVETVRERVKTYFADAPIMIAISRCESHFRQFGATGEIFRGVLNTKDVGVMQINESYHLVVSQKLGHDIHTLEGNLEYARYLYEREGTTPWLSSGYCWLPKQAKELASAAR